MSDRDEAIEAVVRLNDAAREVVKRHDNGTLSMVVGDSASIEALRRALLEETVGKATEAKR